MALNHPFTKPLIEAAKAGDLDKIKELLESKDSPPVDGRLQNTFLSGSYTSRIIAPLRPMGDTAVLAAARNDHTKAVRLLMGFGADISIPGDDGKMVKDFFDFQAGYYSVIEAIVRKEYDVEDGRRGPMQYFTL